MRKFNGDQYMQTLPPPIMTSEKGSFARKTIEELKPGIIDNILSEHNYSSQIQKALLELKSELANGNLRELKENAPDKSLWNKAAEPYIGKSWLEIPWFFAETFFFRRILEATQYFQPGPWQGKDPFQHIKDREISTALEPFIDAYHPASNQTGIKPFQTACYQALWGNQSDLSNMEIYESTNSTEKDKLIFDQSKPAYEYILSRSPSKIAYFLDNVGKELYFDIALIDFLLETKLAESITCYLKSQPFFVSDAQPKDFQKAVDFLSTSSDKNAQNLGKRMINAIKSGRVKSETPPFLTSSFSFREMPGTLKNQISKHDFTILKGDVNFRRLVGDCHWDPTTPLEKAAGYFYTSFMSLRTIKSELMVGLSEEKLNTLETQAEEDWLINGKRGMIIFEKKLIQ